MKKQVHRKGRKLELQTETVKKLVRVTDNELDQIVGAAYQPNSGICGGGSGVRVCDPSDV